MALRKARQHFSLVLVLNSEEFEPAPKRVFVGQCRKHGPPRARLRAPSVACPLDTEGTSTPTQLVVTLIVAYRYE